MSDSKDTTEPGQPLGRVTLILSRLAEAYVDYDPLSFLYQPIKEDRNRKRSKTTYLLPKDLIVTVYDGFAKQSFVVDPCADGEIKMRAVRIIGAVRPVD